MVRPVSKPRDVIDQVLAANLIDDHPSGQHDPIDLFNSLVQHLDSISNHSTLRDVFGVRLRHRTMCPQHGEQFLEADSGLQIVLLAYPERAFRDCQSPDLMILLSDILSDASMARAHCPLCGASSSEASQMIFDRFGTLLAVQMVWPVSKREQAPAFRLLTRGFHLSESVDLSPMLQPDASALNVKADLQGILCRVGDRLDAGHYVTCIRENSVWWLIDDHRVSAMGSLSEAFEEGRTPTMLLFRISQTQRRKERAVMPHHASISVYDEVMIRFNEIKWSNRPLPAWFASPKQPNESFSDLLRKVESPPPGAITREGAYLVCGKPSLLKLEDVRKTFGSPHVWWSSKIIDAVLEVVGQSPNRTHVKSRVLEFTLPSEINPARLRVLGVQFDPVSGEPKAFRGATKGTNPWTSLGSEQWHTAPSVGVVSMSNQTHFATIAIFPTQKLVVTFDSAGGTFDHRSLWEVSELVVQRRTRAESRILELDEPFPSSLGLGSQAWKDEPR